MSDIPEDVMKAAYDTALSYRHDKATDPIHHDGALQECIERAILAERERCRQLLSEAETRERETLTQLSEIAKKEAEELMDKWISDQGATIETKAAGVASHIVNDFRGHIEAALIKLERRSALERSQG